MLNHDLRGRYTPPQHNLLLTSRLRCMLPKHPEDPPEVLFVNLIPLTQQERREPMGKMMCLGVSTINQPEENPLGPDRLNSNLETSSPEVFKETATSVAERVTTLRTAELPLT